MTNEIPGVGLLRQAFHLRQAFGGQVEGQDDPGDITLVIVDLQIRP